MNPIKSHLLDRLRPKDKTMKTITDEEAFELGERAVKAGLQPALGMGTLMRDRVYLIGATEDSGVIDGIHDNAEPINTTRGRCGVFGKGGIVPDLRDPGTKGHAVAQLRERAGDPYLTTHCRLVPWNGAECPEWSIPLIDAGPCFTEEEAIVAAFEASKETP